MPDDEMVSLTPDYDDLDDDEDEDEEEELEDEIMPSLTYKIASHDTVSGYIDELEAMQQAIKLILLTERYDYDIFPWEYGAEMKELYGMPADYCMAELESSIPESLLMDDRISAVDGFSFEEGKGYVTASFVVHTIFGAIDMEQEYNV